MTNENTEINAVIETITPQEANNILLKNNNNRSISKHTIERYVKDMQSGRWQFNGDSIKITGDGNLIDGQHRLTACIKSEVPLKTFVIRGLKQDVFKTIDTGKFRQFSDILDIKGYSYTRNLSAFVKLHKVWSEGERLASRYNGVKISNAEALRHLDANPQLAELPRICRTEYNKATEILGYSTCILLYYLFNKSDHELCHRFFYTLTKGIPIKDNDLVFNLREKVLFSKARGTRINTGTKLLICIRVWNRLKAGNDTGTVTMSHDSILPEVK